MLESRQMKLQRIFSWVSIKCLRELGDILRMLTLLSVSMVTGMRCSSEKIKFGAITSPLESRITSTCLPDGAIILAVISPLSMMSAWLHKKPAMAQMSCFSNVITLWDTSLRASSISVSLICPNSGQRVRAFIVFCSIIFEFKLLCLIDGSFVSAIHATKIRLYFEYPMNSDGNL